jgi:hypothetical protein
MTAGVQAAWTRFLGLATDVFHPSAIATSLLHMMWWTLNATRIPMVLGSWSVACCLAGGCGGEPEVPPEDRIVRVSLGAGDREAIMTDRYAAIREGLLDIRRMEAARPDPEVDRDAYAIHADLLDERTREVISMMADERWTRDERRLMQRVLRFATAEDLGATSAVPDGVPADGG